MAKKTTKRKGQRKGSLRSKTAKTASKAASRKSRQAHRTAGSGINDQALREHLLYVLRGGGAHLDFEKAIAGLPRGLRGVQPPGVPFTAWMLLEHLRIAQWDILEFSRNAKHVSPGFPDEYWPQSDAPSDDAAWESSIQAFRADLKAMQKLVADSKANLFAPIAHGEGQTLLREALLVADHNAYHSGQLVLLRRLLGAWPGES
jgi:DinB family protein